MIPNKIQTTHRRSEQGMSRIVSPGTRRRCLGRALHHPQCPPPGPAIIGCRPLASPSLHTLRMGASSQFPPAPGAQSISSHHGLCSSPTGHWSAPHQHGDRPLPAHQPRPAPPGGDQHQGDRLQPPLFILSVQCSREQVRR